MEQYDRLPVVLTRRVFFERVAENTGMETEEHPNRLKALDCEAVRCFLYYRPMREEELLKCIN